MLHNGYSMFKKKISYLLCHLILLWTGISNLLGDFD
ncbi:unnamed protein product [Nezara viridula]|uniref:Uncharacterized protein n=1 Tax=Nezara viridula TaxID=85310 RepID=A0A9P0HBK6_NEZVI|nr:unnamed protein product [Nezara viridula]